MRRLGIYDFTFVALIMIFSFLPFMQPVDSWNGYGSQGSHFYKNKLYEIHYSDHSSGVGKPQIYLTNGHDRVPLIELSDHTSTLEGLKIYPDLKSKVRINEQELEASYAGNGITLTKRVKPDNEYIRITYTADRKVNLSLSLWRWYYEEVMGITKYNWKTLKLQPVNELVFSFQSAGRLCAAKLFTQPTPNELLVEGDHLGINKIILSFRSKTVDLWIKADPSCPVGSGISASSMFVYPVIAGSLSTIYLGARWFTHNLKIRDKPSQASILQCNPKVQLTVALISGVIRLVIAPFFMHVWDITTIQESLEDFLQGRNVYETVQEKTEMLRNVNGVEANYEGYTYLPHPLLVYSPFYLLYKTVTNGKPPIVGGHFEQTFELIRPNIYIFLELMKTPIIVADVVITYIVVKKSLRAGLIYAFLPYSILITSIWGQFDALVGLLLLLTAITVNKRPLLGGIFFGMATMKIFILVALPALLLSLQREKRSYAMFLAGLTISQIPALLFLAQNSEAMLSALLFHTSRSPGGINILHLAPKLYSYDAQSAVNKIALLILGSTILVHALKIKRNNVVMSLTIPILTYLTLGPVTNEQHLASLIPLLIYEERYLLTIGLSNIYVAYALLYSGPTYFTQPLSATSNTLRAFLISMDQSWNTIFGGTTFQLLYLLAILGTFTVVSFIRKTAY
ncbi:MAG: hypothetical protein QXU44_07055 [Candidatus Caldarchaeum sp.]